jgi:hypothetical protein
MLAGEIDTVVPLGGMQQLSLEVVQAGDCRPTPIVQDSTR